MDVFILLLYISIVIFDQVFSLFTQQISEPIKVHSGFLCQKLGFPFPIPKCLRSLWCSLLLSQALRWKA